MQYVTGGGGIRKGDDATTNFRTYTIATDSQLDTDIYGYISISANPVVMEKGELRRDIRIVATKLQGFYVSVRSTVINGPRFSMGCQGNQGGKDTEGLIKT